MRSIDFHFRRALARQCALLFTLVAAPVGCSSGNGVAQVSGRVTLDGAPVADASVTFQPVAKSGGDAGGTGSYGRTNGEGRYVLKSVYDDAPGAAIGLNRVLISTIGSGGGSRSDDGRSSKETSPLKFRDGSVTFDVPNGGAEDADFELGEAPN